MYQLYSSFKCITLLKLTTDVQSIARPLCNSRVTCNPRAMKIWKSLFTRNGSNKNIKNHIVGIKIGVTGVRSVHTGLIRSPRTLLKFLFDEKIEIHSQISRHKTFPLNSWKFRRQVWRQCWPGYMRKLRSKWI